MRKKKINCKKNIDLIEKAFLKKINKDKIYCPAGYYHKKKIHPEEQFKFNECTVSYLLKNKCAVLNNKNYSSVFLENIKEYFPNLKIKKILEIGPGSGYLARTLCKKINAKYFFCDISFDFLKNIKKKLKTNLVVVADAHKLPFKNNSFDFAIANEIIADFEFKTLKDKKEINFYKKILLFKKNEKFNLQLNTGAIRLIIQLKNILKKNSGAIITEYGNFNKGISSVWLTDHFEHSINFDSLERVCHFLNLKYKTINFINFLKINRYIKILNEKSYNYLSKKLKNKIIPPFSEKEFNNFIKKKGLKIDKNKIKFNYIKHKIISFNLKEFYALFIKKS